MNSHEPPGALPPSQSDIMEVEYDLSKLTVEDVFGYSVTIRVDDDAGNNLTKFQAFLSAFTDYS
jgi:hypothetical protein